jgi:hypothetical protein
MKIKRKYNLTKPRTLTHPQNRIKPFDERKVQIFFSVKGKHYKEAQLIISQLIKQKQWN